MIDFGLRNPDNIKMIESYELPDLFQENIEEAGISQYNWKQRKYFDEKNIMLIRLYW